MSLVLILLLLLFEKHLRKRKRYCQKAATDSSRKKTIKNYLGGYKKKKGNPFVTFFGQIMGVCLIDWGCTMYFRWNFAISHSLSKHMCG